VLEDMNFSFTKWTRGTKPTLSVVGAHFVCDTSYLDRGAGYACCRNAADSFIGAAKGSWRKPIQTDRCDSLSRRNGRPDAADDAG
jgi:hypothetical protein